MFLYLLAVSGVMVHIHYCGGELADWNLYQHGAGCGDKECSDDTEQSSGCCKDKVIAAKVSLDQKVADQFKIMLGAGDFIIVGMPARWSVPDNHFPDAIGYNGSCHLANAPPGRWQDIPLHKLLVRFTYYG